MLTRFDWLRRCKTGAELLATLEYFASELPFRPTPDLLSNEEIGAPHTALTGPCSRCWIYPRQSEPAAEYCSGCQAILEKSYRLGYTSRQSIVIWGNVNQLPKQLQKEGSGFETPWVGEYVHDQQRFLLVLLRKNLKPWLQELMLYYGADLKGILQIFPTSGSTSNIGMGDILCRAIRYEDFISMDRLWVRFYSDPFQVLRPHERDKKGQLNFEISEFISLLEMAAVFRTILRPDEQKMLQELLKVRDTAEEQFYWGRLVGYLSQEAKDMLSAWKIRAWPQARVQLLYELTSYVEFYRADQTHSLPVRMAG